MATTYFSHCWGVFEGGGVRAAAHAGAYAAAREAGIVFGRVAGTSGGSIVAALVAAGAAPEYVSEHLQQTNLSRFQTRANPRESVFARQSWKLRVLRRVTWGNLKAFANVALDSGLYSSQPLQEWLEILLREVVAPRRGPGVTGAVQFAELQIPLYVVATDLTSGKPKVWSLETTPEDSVAFAVRCSCSIPFFYQAVACQQSILVDGGAVSNLPSFVFTRLLNSDEGRSVLSRVLAFRLIEDADPRQGISNLKDFASRLSNAVIDGASHIQSTLQPNVYDIAIPTGSIKSTDFEGVRQKEKQQLHMAGMTAVRNFVSNERIVVRSSRASPVFRGFDEKLLLLIQELQVCGKVFLAVCKSTYWLEFVFPTVLSVARRGIQMVCLTVRPENPDELRRVSLLTRLGADIAYMPEPPFDGFLFDVGSERASAILSTKDVSADPAEIYTGELVRVYTNDSDRAVLEMLNEKVEGHWKAKPIVARQLPYAKRSEVDLFGLLRNVPQYTDAKFILADVEVSDGVRVLQEVVKEYKVLQIKQHMQDLLAHGCDLFGVREVSLISGAGTIVTPPVLERVNAETLVIIDGNTRFFHCLATGIESVKAVIVENVSARLPAQRPMPLSALRLTSSTTTLANNYRNFEKSLYRPIEHAVHPYVPE